MEKFVKQFKFKSLKIEFFIFYASPDDKIYYSLYAKCCELETIQVGHTSPLLPSITGRPIILDEVALNFPELKIIAGHIGWPWTEEMVSQEICIFGTDWLVLPFSRPIKEIEALLLGESVKRKFLRGNALRVFKFD
jgi:uncharacterized protein